MNAQKCPKMHRLEVFHILDTDWVQIQLGSYNISIAETASKKIGALIRSGKFLSPKVPLYKSTMEYLCHVWAGAPIYYIELLEIL